MTLPPFPDLPDAQAFATARAVLDDVVTLTPTAVAVALSERLGVQVHLKCENLQRTGSFKLRGAYVRMASLTPEERARGVVAASAGNHGQGVALAASLLGIRATVFMPVDASLPKVGATAGYGADVRLDGGSVEDALAAAERFAAREGAVLLHPFDHPAVVAGQGTIGLEILEQVPDVRTVLVPTGGGGLLAGIAGALAAPAPWVEVVGVQSAAVPGAAASLAAGHPVAVTPEPTIADGIAVARPGAVPFAVIQEHVRRILTVGEGALARGLLHCLERYKVLVEPSGAAGIAALLDDPPALEGPVVVVLSGGNVDPLLLSRILRSGLVAAGRFQRLRLRLTDRPGSLAALVALLAEQQANVVTIEHHRLDPDLDVDAVEITVELETRGHEHRRTIEAALTAAGYRALTPTQDAANRLAGGQPV